MSHAVLKNKTTDLNPNFGVSDNKRRDVADALADVLSDSFRLYINAQGLHWNAEGPMFFSLHQLTEAQYEDLAKANDKLAERIRALGLPAPQSLEEFQRRSAIEDLPASEPLEGRILRLIDDYEAAAARALRTVSIADSAGDVMTADLLTARIGRYEENAWMLRATIAS
ncbi:MAG: DNA starvation/stationary phase protection protein [Pseudomonadota bacterium]